MLNRFVLERISTDEIIKPLNKWVEILIFNGYNIVELMVEDIPCKSTYELENPELGTVFLTAYPNQYIILESTDIDRMAFIDSIEKINIPSKISTNVQKKGRFNMRNAMLLETTQGENVPKELFKWAKKLDMLGFVVSDIWENDTYHDTIETGFTFSLHDKVLVLMGDTAGDIWVECDSTSMESGIFLDIVTKIFRI